MSRVFRFDNENEIKLKLDGFDKAPMLIGSEKSTGEISLENLNKFTGCNLSTKSVNVKNDLGEIIELRTYYTIAEAIEPMYNNEIISNFEKNDDSILGVEVCIGKGEHKRYDILEYAATLNMVEISKKVPVDLYAKFLGNKEDEENVDEVEINKPVNIVLYDEDGFETSYEMRLSDIADSILSVRIISSSANKNIKKVSKKAKKTFEMIKEDGKNKVESISNFASSVIKMVSAKKNI